MKLMKAEQIPQFVQDVVALGCEICAIGDVHYVFGDADLPIERAEALAPEFLRINETYGVASISRGRLSPTSTPSAAMSISTTTTP